MDITYPIKWLCNYNDILLCLLASTASSLDKEPSTTISHGFGPEPQQELQ